MARIVTSLRVAPESASEIGFDLSSSWDIYDRLLGAIPEDIVVASCLMGRSWTVVDSGGMGVAMTYRGDSRGTNLRPPHAGRRLQDMAAYLKSWNLYEASLGVAAVNSFYNTPERVGSWLRKPLAAVRSKGALTDMLDDVTGKKVAVIGHFPDMKAAAERCELTVLERSPQEGDLPDFAAEYVLPEQDFVFITGLTVTNRPFPAARLSAQATVGHGPSARCAVVVRSWGGRAGRHGGGRPGWGGAIVKKGGGVR